MDGVLGILNGKGGKNSGGPTTYIVSPPAPVSGDLDIIDSNGATVGEDKEESPGGWVPVNNDNDNYNFVAGHATNTTHRLDKIESTKVDRENDLVQITAHAVAAEVNGDQIFYSLNWYSDKIKVWKSPDKNDGQATSPYSLPTGLTLNLWVEGFDLNSSMAAEVITLKYHDAFRTYEYDADIIQFTVYEVKGAMNVPGYSKYKYEARVPSDSGFIPDFVSITGGTVG
jgi:hypothetical protein